MNKNSLITINDKAVKALSEVTVTRELIESGQLGPAYESLKSIIKSLDDVKKGLEQKIKDTITPLYEEDGTATLEDDKYKYTLVAATTSLNVDTAKLKTEYPDVYKACVKTVNKAASLRVTEKKAGE